MGGVIINHFCEPLLPGNILFPLEVSSYKREFYHGYFALVSMVLLNGTTLWFIPKMEKMVFMILGILACTIATSEGHCMLVGHIIIY